MNGYVCRLCWQYFETLPEGVEELSSRLFRFSNGEVHELKLIRHSVQHVPSHKQHQRVDCTTCNTNIKQAEESDAT